MREKKKKKKKKKGKKNVDDTQESPLASFRPSTMQ